MKVVVDTNVVVSGVFFGGMPSRVLEAWRDGKIEIVVSPDILEEYRRVGEKLASRFEGVTLAPFLALLATKAKIVDPPDLPKKVSRDPDDDKFIACAVASKSRFIVSGDKDLLEASGHRGIKIVTPREFLDSVL